MFKFRRPSPALVVSIIALVMATAGTATAARVLITSSKQIKKNSVNGGDVADGSLSSRDLRKSTIDADAIKNGAVGTDELSTSARQAITSAQLTAFEAFRKAGPEAQTQNTMARVVTLSNLEPGVYAIFAKSMITVVRANNQLLNADQSQSAHCVLDAQGDKDEARQFLGAVGGSAPSELNMQITRTFGSTGQVTMECTSDALEWRASDSTIIALKVAKAPRQAVDG